MLEQTGIVVQLQNIRCGSQVYKNILAQTQFKMVFQSLSQLHPYYFSQHPAEIP